MSKPAFDANVKNYTTEQLMELVGLTPDDLTNPAAIVNQTNHFMAKYPKAANFGQEIQNIMLQMSAELAAGADVATPAAAQQQRNWFQNEALKQDDEAQTEKITARKQKIDVYGNQHVPMNREHLGVNNSYVLPWAQDVLNPNLRTSTQRIVNLDSQFREPAGGETSTNYTCNLRDTIYRAMSLRLYSFQIPYTWYAIDTAYGNTCFWVVAGGQYIAVSVAPGNYADAAFAGVLSTALIAAGFSFGAGVTPVTYSANTGKLTFWLYDAVFNGVDIYGDPAAFTVDVLTQLLFFDFAGKVFCGTSCTQKGHYMNSTLGWVMGFRTPYVSVDVAGNTPPAVMDLNGPKYLLLAIDDYCQNHVNHGLVSIDQPNRHFKLPGYYTPNIPYTCLPAGAGTAAALTTLVEEVEEDGVVTDTEGMLIGAKYSAEYTPTQIVLPSAPRVLTGAQIYTINEINRVNNNNVSYLAPSPSSPDILSLLPVKVNGLGVSDMIIEFSGSLQDNVRNYFGPVNIKRLGVRLLDDKGHVLNLNGADWNVTLIFDCLYQY